MNLRIHIVTEIIVLVDDTREDMSTKLERWKEALEPNR